MTVEFRAVGKTSFPYLTEGIDLYEKRLKHYLTYQSVIVPDVRHAKNMSPSELKKKEGEGLLRKTDERDFIVLLDEKGKSYSSEKFARFLEKHRQMSHKRILFMVGGAFGFSQSVYDRADALLSLSDMTFSHQMIRLFFTEQLYRACTILRNEPYHNS